MKLFYERTMHCTHSKTHNNVFWLINLLKYTKNQPGVITEDSNTTIWGSKKGTTVVIFTIFNFRANHAQPLATTLIV